MPAAMGIVAAVTEAAVATDEGKVQECTVRRPLRIKAGRLPVSPAIAEPARNRCAPLRANCYVHLRSSLRLLIRPPGAPLDNASPNGLSDRKCDAGQIGHAIGGAIADKKLGNNLGTIAPKHRG